MDLSTNNFLTDFQSKELGYIERFKHAVIVNIGENIEEIQVEKMIDLLAEWTGNFIYRKGLELLKDEIQFIIKPFDFNKSLSIGIDIKAKKVFPPTIGRYIANLVHQYKILQTRIKSLKIELKIEHDRVLRYQEQVVALHSISSNDNKLQIEEMFPTLFGAEEEFE